MNRIKYSALYSAEYNFNAFLGMLFLKTSQAKEFTKSVSHLAQKCKRTL